MRANLPFVVSGFVLGIWLRSFIDFGWALPGLVLLLGLVFVSQKHFGIAFVCLGLVLGIARYNMHDRTGELALPLGLQQLEVLIIDEDRKSTRLNSSHMSI